MSDIAPYANGVMTNPPCTKSDLTTIVSAFQPSKDFTTADTFYLVSTWNTQNPTKLINGDTAEYLLHS